MAKITSTGRGRPRKDISDVKYVESSATSNDQHDRVREVSEVGLEVSGQPSREDKSWLALKLAIVSESRLVARCWHPSPESDIVATNASDVLSNVGEAAYQLSTGEIIKL